jgi:diaphanous 2
LACEEIRDSKKFAKLLELVLLIGNYLNTGTKNAQAVGFEISYLPKVRLKKKKLSGIQMKAFHLKLIRLFF